MGVMDKTDGHFYIDYEVRDNRYRAVQVAPANNEFLAIAEESESLEDLLNRCRESGLKHLVGLDSSAIEKILYWIRSRPALELVKDLWQGESNLSTKSPMGFTPPKRTA